MSREEWRYTTLGIETDILAGFPFKSQLFSENSTDIPLLRGDNVSQGRLRWEHRRLWPRALAGQYEGFLLRDRDVILAMDRPWIEAGLKYSCISANDLPCLLVQRVARLRARDSLDQRFLSYVIASREFTEYVLAVQTGTSIPHISTRQIAEFSFQCPPIGEQRAIAGILRALDDKVELNRGMTRTLEEMTQALFKSWFVDFDPLTNQGERDRYKLHTNGQEGYPDRLIESDLGLIPNRWRVGTVDDLVRVSREAIHPSSRPHEMFAHYSIPAFDNGRTPSHEAGSAIQSTKFVVPEEVVLLSKLNPETPRVWLPYRDSSLPAVCSTEFLVCQARAPARPAYLYCLFGDRDFQGEFGGRVTGTSKSHQRVRPQDLKSIRVVVPDREVVGAFVNRVQPWFELVESAWRESKTLLALRETLATKLLSGELRVREAEKLVEQAV